MPFIDGKFYANPAYGRALESARAAEPGKDADPPHPTEDGNGQPLGDN